MNRKYHKYAVTSMWTAAMVFIMKSLNRKLYLRQPSLWIFLTWLSKQLCYYVAAKGVWLQTDDFLKWLLWLYKCCFVPSSQVMYNICSPQTPFRDIDQLFSLERNQNKQKKPFFNQCRFSCFLKCHQLVRVNFLPWKQRVRLEGDTLA